ncbi:MAG: ABC transporter substrate-binding protein [Dehalococcoidia bacterium]|nr:ABC transporter substrate-binding protein [Dehalococcoidia bacterium]
MFNGKHRGLALVTLLSLMAMTAVACAPAATPTPQPTKAPAAAPTTAAAPTSAAVATKPAVAAPTTAPAASTEPFKIGFVNSASGYMAPMGTPERDAVLMLEEKVNKQGGINGRPLKIVYYDDESDETKGVLAIKKLINDDKVLGIIGTSASGIAMAEVPVAEDAKVPFVTMQSAKSTILPDKKWIFKLPLSEAFYVEALYKWLKGESFTKFAWISQGAGFGREAMKYVDNTAAQQGLTVVVKEEYGPTDTDMTPQLTKVKASAAQALVVYGAEAAGAIVVRQAKDMGITIPVIGPESLTMPAIMGDQQLRNGLENLFVLAHKGDVWLQIPDTDSQKTVLKGLAADLQAKYGATRTMSMWDGVANDAFNVMVGALQKANPDPTKLEDARSKVRDAIEQVKGYLGATSTLNYSASDHEGGVDFKAGVINQVKGGTFKLIKGLQ